MSLNKWRCFPFEFIQADGGCFSFAVFSQQAERAVEINWLLNRICLKTTQKGRVAPRLMSQSSSSLFKPTQWLQVRPSGDHSLELLLFYMGYYWQHAYIYVYIFTVCMYIYRERDKVMHTHQ